MVAAVSHKNVKSVFVGKSVFENMKTAILVISFGTSHRDTLEKTIGAVEKKLKYEFKTDVFLAISSISSETIKFNISFLVSLLSLIKILLYFSIIGKMLEIAKESLELYEQKIKEKI